MKGLITNYCALALCILGTPDPVNENHRIYPTVEESLAYMSGKESLQQEKEETKSMQMCFFS